MKVNVVLLLIAFAIAALAAFGFYAGNGDETYRWVITIGFGVGLFVTLGGIFALSSANGGTVNIKVTSVLFFIALLIENLVFSFTAVRLAPYIIITGILLLVYVLVVYGIYRALK
ncbi:hypothetical protein FACS1894130_10290 [Spirochaetia bacterium]|nr:hypothetical protein FACS1894130_10290 [Spirochaetia bacterium]